MLLPQQAVEVTQASTAVERAHQDMDLHLIMELARMLMPTLKHLQLDLLRMECLKHRVFQRVMQLELPAMVMEQQLPILMETPNLSVMPLKVVLPHLILIVEAELTQKQELTIQLMAHHTEMPLAVETTHQTQLVSVQAQEQPQIVEVQPLQELEQVLQSDKAIPLTPMVEHLQELMQERHQDLRMEWVHSEMVTVIHTQEETRTQQLTAQDLSRLSLLGKTAQQAQVQSQVLLPRLLK